MGSRTIDAGVAPRLSEPWILDSEVMVKPLYGRQEGDDYRANVVFGG